MIISDKIVWGRVEQGKFTVTIEYVLKELENSFAVRMRKYGEWLKQERCVPSIEIEVTNR